MHTSLIMLLNLEKIFVAKWLLNINKLGKEEEL